MPMDLKSWNWFNKLLSNGDLSEIYLGRERSPHYVLGSASPFTFRFARSTNDNSLVAAVHCGHFAQNLGGVVQGGAISSIFDALTAVAGTVKLQSMGFNTTKSLSVQFRAPTPLLSVLKFQVVSSEFNQETGTGVVEAELVNGDTGKLYASCTAQLIDMKRRRRWKKQHPKAKL